MNVAKGYRNILFAHAQKSADANDQGADVTGLVDKNVIDVADLIVGGIIHILLIEAGHGGPGGQCCEDLGCRLLRQGRYGEPIILTALPWSFRISPRRRLPEPQVDLLREAIHLSVQRRERRIDRRHSTSC